MKSWYGCAVALVAACSPRSQPAPIPAPDPVVAQFREAELRLLELTDPPGWVVSRTTDGQVRHTGDSLLWTGMALGTLTCSEGDTVEDALTAMLESGKIYRHPNEQDRAVSLDGELGLLWGIAKRAERCPESKDHWARVIELYEPQNLGASFDVVLGAVRYRLGLDAAPGLARVDGLANLVAGWAALVVAKKAAGYRIHLGWLALGTVGNKGAAFCAATPGAGMDLINLFCGRGELFPWIDAFEYNRWEYHHQRAKWESEDGNGLVTPGLDLLVALRETYQF